MKRAFSRARVGLLVFIGVLTFVVGVFFIGQKSQLFSDTFEVKVNFSSAEGAKAGSVVVLSGYNVGTVSSIQLSDGADSVRLTMKINEEVHKFIKADSRAEIKQEGLVGNKIINLMIGSPELEAIQDGGYIQGVPPFALTSLADNVTAITDTTKRISGVLLNLFTDLNDGKGTAGKFLKDDELYNRFALITARTDTSLDLMISQIEDLTKLLTNVTKSVDQLVLNADSAVVQVNTITKETSKLVTNLNDGKGTIGALLSDRELYDSLVTLVDALTDVSYDASNVTNETAQSINAMRRHWLLGRFMGGNDIADEERPVSSYQSRMQEVDRLLKELKARQERIRARERELGIHPEGK
jgi:phospholipid/cholesterol/gamma-HCH transport system substrate-binding protein